MIENYDSLIKEINRDFFLFRNGIVADNLKPLYPQDTRIFGLMAPQFMELAKKYPHDKELGLRLWDDGKTREPRILALYLLPPDDIDLQLAKKLFSEIKSMEEAELLPFRIFRYLPFASTLYEELSKDEKLDDIKKYSLKMLKKNLDAISH